MMPKQTKSDMTGALLRRRPQPSPTLVSANCSFWACLRMPAARAILMTSLRLFVSLLQHFETLCQRHRRRHLIFKIKLLCHLNVEMTKPEAAFACIPHRETGRGNAAWSSWKRSLSIWILFSGFICIFCDASLTRMGEGGLVQGMSSILTNFWPVKHLRLFQLAKGREKGWQ